MQPRGVIPRPFPERLRDARTKVLPTLVFLCTVALITLIWRAHFIPARISAEADILLPEEQEMAVTMDGEASEAVEENTLVSVTGTAGGPIKDRPYAQTERTSRN